MDKSELDLCNIKWHETRTLVLNQWQRWDESYAKLAIAVPGVVVEPAKVKQGDTFRLKRHLADQQTTDEFQVRQINSLGVTVTNLTTGEELQLQQMD